MADSCDIIDYRPGKQNLMSEIETESHGFLQIMLSSVLSALCSASRCSLPVIRFLEVPQAALFPSVIRTIGSSKWQRLKFIIISLWLICLQNLRLYFTGFRVADHFLRLSVRWVVPSCSCQSPSWHLHINSTGDLRSIMSGYGAVINVRKEHGRSSASRCKVSYAYI